MPQKKYKGFACNCQALFHHYNMHKIFISYSSKNADWVKNWLVPKIESQGVPAHVDYRDFEIGVPSVINMERAVEQCAKNTFTISDGEYE